MKTSIFVDTGAFFALEYKQDQFHSEATAVFAKIKSKRLELITTTLIINETVTMLQRKCGYEFALRFLSTLLESRNVEIITMNGQFMSKVWSEFKQKAAEGLTLTDCLSRVIIKTRKIRHVFAFDQHLKTSGSVLLKG